jgi:hypothetical protein
MLSRIAIVLIGAIAPMVATSLVAPPVSSAQRCGTGTVYDAGSDSCVAAQPPPPPPPAIPPGVTVCPPIPFVGICFPVS